MLSHFVVQGSVEAIREVLQALPQDTVALRFLMQSTGEISASDVDLALASGAIVVGFNVGVQASVQAQAESEGVEIRLYRVIYDLVDDIRKAMEGMLEDVEVKASDSSAHINSIHWKEYHWNGGLVSLYSYLFGFVLFCCVLFLLSSWNRSKACGIFICRKKCQSGKPKLEPCLELEVER